MEIEGFAAIGTEVKVFRLGCDPSSPAHGWNGCQRQRGRDGEPDHALQEELRRHEMLAAREDQTSRVSSREKANNTSPCEGRTT